MFLDTMRVMKQCKVGDWCSQQNCQKTLWLRFAKPPKIFGQPSLIGLNRKWASTPIDIFWNISLQFVYISLSLVTLISGTMMGHLSFDWMLEKDSFESWWNACDSENNFLVELVVYKLKFQRKEPWGQVRNLYGFSLR